MAQSSVSPDDSFAPIDTAMSDHLGSSPAHRRTPAGLRTIAACDRGQDLNEYALLTALVGIISVAAWSAIEGSLGAAYTNYDTGTQSIWASPDPQ
jgi:Flp pilus assembly pilin Flp